MKIKGYGLARWALTLAIPAGAGLSAFGVEARAAQSAGECEAGGDVTGSPRLVSVTREDNEDDEIEAGAGPAATPLNWQVAWPSLSTSPLAAVDKPVVGGTIRILRCLPPGRWAVVGQGRVDKLNGSLVEASVRIDADRTDTSALGHAPRVLALRGNLFPRPMVGDRVVPVRAEVRIKSRLDPRVELDARPLFAAGDALTEQGRERLREELGRFARSSGRLFVEAHIVTPGDRGALRRTSQLRADAVAQFAAREMGIEADRIVSVGFGSDSLTAGLQDVPAWPAKISNEKIVLRVLPAQ